MHQSFKPWVPIENSAGYFSIESLVDDSEGLRVFLRELGTRRLIKILFGDRLIYQCRDESDLAGEMARSEGRGKGCFYIVNESELIARFIKESVRSYDGIVHYCIVTDADCIDVLVLADPEAEDVLICTES